MAKNDLYVSPNGEIITIQKISKKNGITIEYQNGETFQISPLNFKSNFIKVRNNQLSAPPQMETKTQIQISNLERELYHQLNLLSEYTKKFAPDNGNMNMNWQHEINTTETEIKKLRAKIAKLKNN